MIRMLILLVLVRGIIRVLWKLLGSLVKVKSKKDIIFAKTKSVSKELYFKMVLITLDGRKRASFMVTVNTSMSVVKLKKDSMRMMSL